MIFLDGVYVTRSSGGHRFVQVEAPTSAELTRLVVQISERVGRHLERRPLSRIPALRGISTSLYVTGCWCAMPRMPIWNGTVK